MQFGDVNALKWMGLAFLLLALAILSHKTRMRRLKRISNHADRKINDMLLYPLSILSTQMKIIALLFAGLLLTFSLAKPRIGYEWSDLKTEGVDIMIALDVSSSMRAADLKPSRLERAKREIKDLLHILDGDRIGLVVFAGVGFVQCPLTADYKTLRSFLDHISEEMIPVGGTAIGSAIDIAAESLSKYSSAGSEGKAIIVITDGEDQGTDPIEAAKVAATKDIKTYVIGVGSLDGAPIPLDDGGFKKDKSGNIVMSKLKENQLVEIAQAGGGAYVRSESGEMDLDVIYRTGINKKIAGYERDAGREKIWFERFHWFLLAGFVLLVIEMLIREFRMHKTSQGEASPASNSSASNRISTSKGKSAWAKSLLICGIAGGGFLVENGAEGSQKLKQAHEHFEKGEYDKSADTFLQEEVESPDDDQIKYNRSVADYKAGNYGRAAEGFRSLLESENDAIREKSKYNLGNALAAQQQYEQALQSYKDYLEHNADDMEARENMGWAQKMIEMQKEQEKQENQNSEDGEKQDGDKQDSEKQDSEKQDGDKQEGENKESGDKQDQQGDSSQTQDQEGDEQKNQGESQEDQSQEQENGSQQSEEEANEEAAGEENAEESESQQGESKQLDSQEAQERDIDREAAERLLKGLKEADGAYRPLPKIQNQKPEHDKEKDW